MEALIVGLSLGLAAGISPGPLLALVIGSTLQRGFGAGARVAASPLVTDLPIVIIAIGVAGTVPETVLHAMTLVGGAFVVWLGIGTVRDAGGRVELVAEGAAADPVARRRDLLRKDLWSGALVNFLSPHPWLFWLGIGGPLTVGLWRRDEPWAAWGAAGFLFLFYVGLVGSKIVLAALVARGRHRLSTDGYRRLLAVCGWALVGLGLWLAVSGGLALVDDGAVRGAVFGGGSDTVGTVDGDNALLRGLPEMAYGILLLLAAVSVPAGIGPRMELGR